MKKVTVLIDHWCLSRNWEKHKKEVLERTNRGWEVVSIKWLGRPPFPSLWTLEKKIEAIV